MNWDQIEGRWKQMRGDIKSQWGRLTDDDVDQVDGQRDKLVGRVQEAYGIEREEADRQVRDWIEKL
ncbi:CsbD family protein [Thalassospira sp.]|uniref:CsbD family protein n=1 Tax=Thalassospira sp. TaxID=1912094 RepID=UPI003AA9A507